MSIYKYTSVCLCVMMITFSYGCLGDYLHFYLVLYQGMYYQMYGEKRKSVCMRACVCVRGRTDGGLALAQITVDSLANSSPVSYIDALDRYSTTPPPLPRHTHTHIDTG